MHALLELMLRQCKRTNDEEKTLVTLWPDPKAGIIASQRHTRITERSNSN